MVKINFFKKPKPDLSYKQKDPEDNFEKIKWCYNTFILPLEKNSKFPMFYSPSLKDADFNAVPFVLCIGHYSTGKSTFISYLSERESKHLRIGPEPTTDRFIAVMNGKEEKIIPGNTAVSQDDKPFSGLSKFGKEFLNKFDCLELNSPILRKISFIDTPGVVGSEQEEERGYNYMDVVDWFGERAERILVFFDANKTYINEMKKVVPFLKKNEDKVSFVLNKADTITNKQLLHVYGALMWNLRTVIKTPEVPRVYIGSFWNKTEKNEDIKKEETELFADLRSLPRNTFIQKTNNLIKRVNNLKIHYKILLKYKSRFNILNKKSNKKKTNLLSKMDKVIEEVAKENNLHQGDLPPVSVYQNALEKIDFADLKNLKEKDLETIENVLNNDIPGIVRETNGKDDSKSSESARENPNTYVHSADNLYNQNVWAISIAEKAKYDGLFDKIGNKDNKVTVENAKNLTENSDLSPEEQEKIWELVDVTDETHISRDEFALCMYLIDSFKSGNSSKFENGLPLEFVPPSKRVS